MFFSLMYIYLHNRYVLSLSPGYGGGANKPQACHRVSLCHWSGLELQRSLRLFQDTGAEKESPGGVVFPAGVSQSEISAAAGLTGDAAMQRYYTRATEAESLMNDRVH